MLNSTRTLVSGLHFPECPRWHEDRLWFSDMSARRVMAMDADGTLAPVVEVPGHPGGLGWLPDGRLLVVSMADQRLLRLDGTELVEVIDLSHLMTHKCNDMVVDHMGRAYIGSMGFAYDAPHPRYAPGQIALVLPSGEARVVAEDMVFPNGMAISPNGGTMYVAETFGGRITSFDIQPDGALSNRRVWACLEHVLLPDGSLPSAEWHRRRIASYRNGGLVPDGICLDAEGAVWSAVTGSGVVRVAQDGEITHRVQTSAPCFACCLGGPDLRLLYLTCSQWKPGTGIIEALPVDVAGTGSP